MVKSYQIDFRKIIYDFLNQNRGKKFTIRSMYFALKESRTDITFSYGTILKWTDYLIASRQIECENYKVVKFVWLNENKDDKNGSTKTQN